MLIETSDGEAVVIRGTRIQFRDVVFRSSWINDGPSFNFDASVESVGVAQDRCIFVQTDQLIPTEPCFGGSDEGHINARGRIQLIGNCIEAPQMSSIII